jgi:hypothetical protein
MLKAENNEDVIIDYLTMVFGKYRGEVFEIGGREKILEQYLLYARSKHFYAKTHSNITLRVSSIYNNQEDSGIHFYFHSVHLPVHFAIHLGSISANLSTQLPKDFLHFTLDSPNLKKFFQEIYEFNSLYDLLELDDSGTKLRYKESALGILENVYLRFLYDHSEQDLQLETMTQQLFGFINSFLEIINGLFEILEEEQKDQQTKKMVGGARVIPPYNKPAVYIRSLRSKNADHFVKFNNEKLKGQYT